MCFLVPLKPLEKLIRLASFAVSANKNGLIGETEGATDPVVICFVVS